MPVMTRVMMTGLAVLATVSVVGCGSDTEVATAGAAHAMTDATTIGPPEVSDAAGDPVEAPSGLDLDLLGQGSLEGRDVVIWFFAGY